MPTRLKAKPEKLHGCGRLPKWSYAKTLSLVDFERMLGSLSHLSLGERAVAKEYRRRLRNRDFARNSRMQKKAALEELEREVERLHFVEHANELLQAQINNVKISLKIMLEASDAERVLAFAGLSQ